MQKLLNHNDFLSNLILEKIESGELPFVLSDRLVLILLKLNHKICTKLLEDNDNDNRASSKVTLVDYDDTDPDMFTFANSPKIIEFITQQTLTDNQNKNIKFFNNTFNLGTLNKIWSENRTKIKIGRFINKLYPGVYVSAGKPGEDIESFTELVRSERTKEMGIFKFVKGQDIVKYYNESSYEDYIEGSTLNGSCMKYAHCGPYMEFYIKNNIELIVLMSDKQKGKIIGRAILWNIDEMDGTEVTRKFMDRIYVVKFQDLQKFKELARKNGWLYKGTQDMYEDTKIVDTKDGSVEQRKMKIYNIEESHAYPYMDTFKFFNFEDGILTNDDDYNYGYKLESTDGGYEDDSGDQYVYSSYHKGVLDINDVIWSDEENRYISHKEAVHSEYLEEWVTIEYAAENWIYSKIEEDWIPKDNVVYIESKDQYVSDEYARGNYIQCLYNNEYYLWDDGSPSNKYKIVPYELGVVYVITTDVINWKELDVKNLDETDVDKKIDARIKDDGTYFTIYSETKGTNVNFDIGMKNFTIIDGIKKGII